MRLVICVRPNYLRRRLVRRFFGGDSLTVSLPLRDANGRSVIDVADVHAGTHLHTEVIRGAAPTIFECVRSDGAIDLTSSGRVVICGPKNSADVADAIGNDPHLRFVEDAGTWVLEERNGSRAFRSPSDLGERGSDIGYLARASGPGTFISIAGIHAPGSAGVVHWLSGAGNLRRLHRRTRGRPFSAVIGCDIGREPFRVTASRLVALYVGGAAVVGVKDRATNRVAAAPVADTSASTLAPFAAERSAGGADVFTDEHGSYKPLAPLGYCHAAVAHSVREFARGPVHANGIESLWSMFKRGYMGTYHQMSEAHLHRYVDEFCGRHNIRPLDTEAQMASVIEGAAGKRLRYRDLIAA